MPFSTTAIRALKDIVEAAVIPENGGVPGITAVVFDKAGNELFVHSAGTRGASSIDVLTPEHVFWIASCTKMLTALSIMQLVERGRVSLDDSQQLEELCPELRKVQVLRDDGILEPKRRGITLRMLLTHTSGLGYGFHEKLRYYGYSDLIDEFSGRLEDLEMPLIGVDWAGIVLERLTGIRLNDYMQTHLFEPLGLKNINMFPTAQMKSRLAFMSYRDPGGKIFPRDHLYQHALDAETPEEKASLCNSGGGGLFAKPQEYCRILAVLLNNGECPTTGVRLVSERTVAEMFTNQIPQFPQFGRQGGTTAKPELANPMPDLYPTAGNTPQGWGLSCMLTGGATGRSKSTGWWAGLANLFWWVDRENGVGGMVCSQVLALGDAKVMGAWFALETAVYAALREERRSEYGRL